MISRDGTVKKVTVMGGNGGDLRDARFFFVHACKVKIVFFFLLGHIFFINNFLGKIFFAFAPLPPPPHLLITFLMLHPAN